MELVNGGVGGLGWKKDNASLSESLGASEAVRELEAQIEALTERLEALRAQLTVAQAVANKAATAQQLAEFRLMISAPSMPAAQRGAAAAPQPTPVPAQQANMAPPEVAAPAQPVVVKEKDVDWKAQKSARKELKAVFKTEWAKVQHTVDHFVTLVILFTKTRRMLIREACDSPHDMWQLLSNERAVNDSLTSTIFNGRFETAWTGNVLADVTSALRAYYMTEIHDGVMYKTTRYRDDEVSRQTWAIFRSVMTNARTVLSALLGSHSVWLP
jgi:hypothetical protein